MFDNLKGVTARKLRVRHVSHIICIGNIPKGSKEGSLSYISKSQSTLSVIKEADCLQSYYKQHLKVHYSDFPVIFVSE